MKNRPGPLLPAFLLAILCAVFCQATISQASGTSPNKTPAEVFDGMRKSFRPDKAKDVHARYQWNISGPDGGGWWIIVNDGKCDMGKGKIENADVTFAVSDQDWVALSNGTLSGTWAFISGRLKLDGPQSIARKLDSMFP